MRVERLSGDGAATALRGLVPAGASVRDDVGGIVAAVREGGDAALRGFVEQFDGWTGAVRVTPDELESAGAALAPDVRAGLRTAMENVAVIAGTAVRADVEVTLAQGHRVKVRELAVRRAAIYVPGGQAPYPSTVIMGVIAAQVAGVREIVVCAPGGHEAILGACALCDVEEVHRMGGAHAIAALAYGTETIERVDVIAGPGSLYVQEAKRLVSGDVGIDGFLGPSDLLVLAAGDADPALVALDLLAQAEHGAGTVVAAISDDGGLLDELARRLQDAEESGAAAALVEVADLEAGLAVAEAFAPEHLQLVGAAAEALAGRVRAAGCVFVGAESGTAFGDYAAGSNHSLPTGGAARFASALSPRAFRRRMAEVHVGEAASELARAGAPIARAEGFAVHAQSMEARVGKNEAP